MTPTTLSPLRDGCLSPSFSTMEVGWEKQKEVDREGGWMDGRKDGRKEGKKERERK